MNIYYYLHRKCSITKFINPLNQQRTHAFYWPECHLFTVSRYLSGSSGLASVNKKHLLCHMTHYIPSFNPTTISLPLRLENNSQLLIKVYPGKEFIRKNFVNSPERERETRKEYHQKSHLFYSRSDWLQSQHTKCDFLMQSHVALLNSMLIKLATTNYYLLQRVALTSSKRQINCWFFVQHEMCRCCELLDTIKNSLFSLEKKICIYNLKFPSLRIEPDRISTR